MATVPIKISKIGFCNFKFEDGQIPDGWEAPSDISNHYGIEFSFKYSWDGSNCYITNIQSEPIELDSPRHVNRNIELGSSTSIEFRNDKCLTIDFNSTSFVNPKSEFDTTIYQNEPKIYLGENESLEYDVSESSYMLVNFKYENIVDDNGSKVIYYIDIPNIKVPKPSKYENNVVFTEEGVKELINYVKKYPIIDVETVSSTEKEKEEDQDAIWTKYTNGKPCIKVKYGDNTKTFSYGNENINNTIGYKYIAVGSNITFPNETDPLPLEQTSGTIRITIDGTTHEIPVYGLSGAGVNGVNLNGTTTVAGHLLPEKNNIYDLGGDKDASSKKKWRRLYLSGSLGDSNNYIPNAYITTLNGGSNTSVGTSNSAINNGYFTNLTATAATITNLNLPAGSGDTAFDLKGGTSAQFLRGNGNNKNPIWSNELTDSITVGAYLAMNGYSGYTPANKGGFWYDGTHTRIKTYNISGSANDVDFEANRVFNAVWNDYAEYRTTIDLAPGHVVIDQDDGSLSCSTSRLQPGAQVISDTFGHSMGETATAKTPLAVAGRVLVYTYQPRENYHAGMAVCSAPNGTVDIMTKEEIRNYPDCIIGIVSEIPQYQTWGSSNVKVNGRIWIKVK